MVQVTISDSGIGIAEKDLSKIFEEFYRVDNDVNAKVKGTDFHEARFVRASLTGTNLRSARLAGASFEQASLHHFNLSRCDLTRTRFHSSKLSGADLSEARLGRSDLQACDLSEANLDGALLDEANLASADLSRASLVGASIRNANLTSANYTDANLSRADLLESDVSNVNFNRTRGLTRAENLLTVRVSDVRYFDFAIIPAPERLLSWERIRWLGRLPLFGASYSALIAIPFLYYLLDMFNRRVEVFRAWATQELANSGTHTTTARVVLDHVHREPIPSLSLCLLISTFLLGVGATIFALSCPPRVREFSREQWRDELGHSLIHYLPFAWHHRWLRMACVICYAIGGIGVIFVVASKLWNVFWFIVDNM